MKAPITRRTLLKGMLMGGATFVALPILEMFLNRHGTAYADGASLPTRFVLMFWGNGTRIDKWVPTMIGANYPLSPVLAPYAPVKDYLSVVTGTRCQIGGLVHHWGVAGMLSAADYLAADVGTITTLSQPTLDQVVATSLGSTTRYRSLEVGVFSPTKGDEGTTLQYLSHNGPNNVNPAEYSPSALFQRLFGQNTLNQNYGSVLDTVLDDVNSLTSRVSAADKARLDAYFTNLRAIETHLTPATSAACAPAISPGTDSADMSSMALISARSNAMWSLINTALSCDLTRVVSVHYCGASDCITVPPEVFAKTPLFEGGQTPLPNDVTHGMTHNESTYDQPVVQAWSTFYQSQFSNFLQQMKSTPDGAGNLLDNSAVMITSEVSQGRNHSNLHMPMLLAGRASGRLKYPGIHFSGRAPAAGQLSTPTPADSYDANGDITTDAASFMNATNAHLTLLRALGMAQTAFGSKGAATSSVIDALLS